MTRHYDGIDIFFIITITIYFIILFLFLSTFLLGYLEVCFNKSPIKKEILKPVKHYKVYKSNISYVKNNPKEKD